jgi:hypothetical protein
MSTSGTSLVLSEELFGLKSEANHKQDFPMAAIFSSVQIITTN